MSVFKCKMCGGTIEFESGATVGECDSCGSKQTLPRLDSDKKENLYDRANHFRRNNDFDKAMAIYDQILNEDKTDAEAYWSLVLCRYGIEYVEDPASRKRIPTVNRAQFTSILADEDYKSALQYADMSQRILYESEAKTIDEIQKGILAISQKEEPFDVFICYKETDANGRRTQDSVLATDLYHQLTQEGFKVFFSRITLEDKLGTAYEPYIFAALNTAKVMVVLGTRPEYFNAVWVKNEWSRYLALIKNGAKKMLIPAYRDMDPYDLPEEFSHLQAQDMSKLGFMQDLIRGIKKIIGLGTAQETVKEASVVVQPTSNLAPMLRRVSLFLEDGNWQEADEYCEKVLDQEPENAQAYLGKLMAERHVCTQENLKDCAKPLDDSGNYKKAVRFADSELAETLRGYNAYIIERNEYTRMEGIYNNAFKKMKNAFYPDDYKNAAKTFSTIAGFKDADARKEECIEKAHEMEYAQAAQKMSEAQFELGFMTAAKKFEAISGYRDADEQAKRCHDKAKECRLAVEKAAHRQKMAKIVILAVIAFCIVAFIAGYLIYKNSNVYELNIRTNTNGTVTIGKYRGTETQIVIPEKILFKRVTDICDSAFEGCADVTSITIPNSVTSIGKSAFAGCTGLTSITISDGVTSIGESAFSDCSGLTSITAKNTVIASMKDAGFSFNNYPLLTSVKIVDGSIGIDDDLFYSCSHLTSITIPTSVTSIGDSAFYGCTGLTSITIPDSVTSIGDSAFYGCTGLTSVTIPDGVTSIDKTAFRNCTGLTSITIPDGVTSIGDSAFYGCTGLTSITIPDSVTSIGESAFARCTGLTSITIPDSVTSIGESAFARCTGLTSITIPDSVTSIGKSAFADCTGLTSITIPASVTSIGDYAFSGCTGLTSITIPDSVTSIGESAFAGCTGLTSITIPDSVTSIGDSAFYGCTGLTSVTIPDGVTSIGRSAFSGSKKLIIYCAAPSKPSGWNSYWNDTDRIVVWDYKG